MADIIKPPPPFDRPSRRDPVLHETMTAIMWVAHAVTAAVEQRPELARQMLELARGSVFRALELADLPKEPHPL